MTNTASGTAAIGRVLIAVLFLVSGIGKIAAPAATQGFIASAGLPAPLLAYLGSTLIEVGGSLLLILGYRVRLVAAVMAVFAMITAFVFHTNFANPDMVVHFLKNVAITGGLLQVVAYGAGAFSLDARRARRETVSSSEQPQPLSA
jgi:putative oxidoreductase